MDLRNSTYGRLRSSAHKNDIGPGCTIGFLRSHFFLSVRQRIEPPVSRAQKLCTTAPLPLLFNSRLSLRKAAVASFLYDPVPTISHKTPRPHSYVNTYSKSVVVVVPRLFFGRCCFSRCIVHWPWCCPRASTPVTWWL